MFYAIKTSLGEKIVESWDECVKFRDLAPSNAKFKKFAKVEDAQEFLRSLGGIGAAPKKDETFAVPLVSSPVSEKKKSNPNNKQSRPHVIIYSDGACSGNPGPGGWGAILRYGEHEKELSGGEQNTTNNRMELTGVICALQILKEPCIVELYSDSKYVIDALEKGWARSWRDKGWVKSDKKPALNPDLWKTLLSLCETHQVHTHWVKGHAENPYNNRCDQLAVSEWQKLK